MLKYYQLNFLFQRFEIVTVYADNKIRKELNTIMNCISKMNILYNNRPIQHDHVTCSTFEALHFPAKCKTSTCRRYTIFLINNNFRIVYFTSVNRYQENEPNSVLASLHLVQWFLRCIRSIIIIRYIQQIIFPLELHVLNLVKCPDKWLILLLFTST